MPTLYELKIDYFKLSKEYPGKWVAIHPETGQVIASGTSMLEVLEAPSCEKVEDPIITQVSESYGGFVT
ncbi:MAG: DUF5678 domain-containing protein [Candidatus Polarisedimenticolia bacterium]